MLTSKNFNVMKIQNYISHAALCLIIIVTIVIQPAHAQIIPSDNNPSVNQENWWIRGGNNEIAPLPVITGGDPPIVKFPEDEKPTNPYVFWIHGLGGNTESWSKAAVASELGAPTFPARKMLSKRPEYNLSAPTLLTAAHQLSDQSQFFADIYLQDEKSTKHNYIIAHSQGGLVSRYLDHIYEISDRKRAIHGLVTFATAHQGAQIANSVLEVEANGKTRAQNMTTEVCDALAPTELHKVLSKLENSLPKIKFLFMEFKIQLASEKIVETIADSVCVGLPGIINTILSGVINQPLQPGHMLADYMVGAPAVAEMNGFNTNTRKVAFYGIKDETFDSGDLFWRTYHYLNVSPNAYNYFDATSVHEQKTLDYVNKMLMEYNEYKEFYYNRYEVWKKAYEYYIKWQPKDINIEALFKEQIKHNLWASTIYKTGHDFLINFDPVWRTTIGAEILAPVITGYRCKCSGFFINENGKFEELYEESIVDNPEACIPSQIGPKIKCHTSAIVKINKTLKASDGIVLAESAMNFPGAWEPILLSNTSHMQMRNSLETKRVLLDLYDGKIANSGFKLDKK